MLLNCMLLVQFVYLNLDIGSMNIEITFYLTVVSILMIKILTPIIIK